MAEQQIPQLGGGQQLVSKGGSETSQQFQTYIDTLIDGSSSLAFKDGV